MEKETKNGHYELKRHEQELLKELQRDLTVIQQQMQGALRLMLKERGLTGTNWIVDENFDYLSQAPQQLQNVAPETNK